LIDEPPDHLAQSVATLSERQRLEEMGYEVGPRLLAQQFGVSEEDVRDVESALGSRDVSLEEPLGGDTDRRQQDVLVDAESPDAEELVARGEMQDRVRGALDEFLRDLSERDLALLDLRILSEEPLTLQALGERFGTTREAVRQAEARLMKRLESFMRERLGDLGDVKIGPG